MIEAFIYGIALAFGLIIPLGAQNIFVFNQGASQVHFLHALPSVITAFICDTLLIVIAVMGVSTVVLALPWLKTIIFTVGILFLFYMGWNTWKSKTSLEGDRKPFSAIKQISFSASVSLLNPHAIIDTIGVIGTSSLNLSSPNKFAFTLACILVSFFWFLGLTIAGHFINKVDRSGLGILFVNKISALIMWGIGFYLVFSL